MNTMHFRARSRRAFSLVEILIAIALIVALAASLGYFYVGKSKPGEPKKVTPMSKAHDTVCLSNIRQVRQAIEVYKAGDSDGKLPESLADLKLPREVIECEETHKPFEYDPATGTVRDTTPGHENF